MFRKALDSFKWALIHKDISGVNFERISSMVQNDVDARTFERDVLDHSLNFRLLPFSPLMEDKITRRAHLIELVQYLSSASPLAEAIDQKELAREIVDAFGFRPSIVRSEEPPSEEAGPGGMGGLEEMAAMGGGPEGGMPPELAAALAGMPPIPEG